jgi:type IV secretion system protein VirB11
MPPENAPTGDRRHSATEARRTASLTHAYGPTIDELRRNPLVTDIMLNSDGTLWCEEQGKGRRKVGEMSASRAESLIRLVASHMGTEATRERPMVEGVLPGTNARFQGILPPVTLRPTFAIRKPSGLIFSLDDYVRNGVITQRGADHLRDAIERRVNLLIAGGTGSGKTTLANACLAEPAFRRDRIVLIEDTRELQCLAEDRVELVVPPLLPGISMEELLRTTLRLFPRRIVIGEVRGREALTMVKAWGTGHPGGLCTIHANGPKDALYRLEELIGEVAVSTPRRSIARAIGLVVYIERGSFGPAGRRVTGIGRPSLGTGEEYEFEDLQL